MESQPIPGPLQDLVLHLSQDPSHEVQSYVPEPIQFKRLDLTDEQPLPPAKPRSNKRNANLSTFSRPPPARASSKQDIAFLAPSTQDSGNIVIPTNNAPHVVRAFGGSRSGDMIDNDKMDVPQVLGLLPSFGASSTPGTGPASEITPTIGQRSLISLPAGGHGGAPENTFDIGSKDMDANSNASILVPAA